MTLFKSSNRPAPVWFIVERDHGSTAAFCRSNRQHALADFTEWLDATAAQGEGFTPFQPGRQLAVHGPAERERADGDDAEAYEPGDKPDRNDPADPWLHPDVALHTVLTTDEYRLFVEHPVASALLES